MYPLPPWKCDKVLEQKTLGLDFGALKLGSVGGLERGVREATFGF
jgi:hypothetical protein